MKAVKSNLRSRVYDNIQQKQLIQHGESVLVAVSGGMDSSVLLHVLHKLKEALHCTLVVAHFNHQLRGADAMLDETFVRELASRYQLPIVVERADVASFAKQQQMGIEEAGRTLRYAFFQRAANDWDCQAIAVAHHADDQVETVFMRILRGTGLKGLGGIPELRWLGRRRIIRPFLPFFRQELEQYCQANQLHYQVDQSNETEVYLRNRIRLSLIPMLTTYNPRFKEAILQLANQSARDDLLLDECSRKYFQQLVEKEENQWILDGKGIKTLPVALQWRIIKLILDYLPFEGRHIHVEDILKLMRSGSPSGYLNLSDGWYVHRSYDQIMFQQNWTPPMPKVFSYPIPASGCVVVPEFDKKCWVIPSKHYPRDVEIFAPWAVFDQADFPTEGLVIRSRQDGDWMKPKGLLGTKKVKDLFIDAKWPQQRRVTTPLLARGQEVFWIPGLRQSWRAGIHEHTDSFLYFVLTDMEEDQPLITI